MKKTVAEIVTKRIMDQIETAIKNGEAKAPWQMPWTNIQPVNFVSRTKYRGSNRMLLSCLGLKRPFFATIKQAASLGGKLKSNMGAFDGYPVIFWKFWVEEKTDEQTGEVRKQSKSLMRFFTVFHIDQFEGVDESKIQDLELQLKDNQNILDADTVLDCYEDHPEIQHGNNLAAYSPDLDLIIMPDKERFISSSHYYTTLFHELTHSTGAAKRLNRPGITEARTKELYSKEELIAEIGAAFLCAETGIENQGTQESSINYLRGWLEKLNNDPSLILFAAARAQNAVDHMLKARTTMQEPETEE